MADFDEQVCSWERSPHNYQFEHAQYVRILFNGSTERHGQVMVFRHQICWTAEEDLLGTYCFYTAKQVRFLCTRSIILIVNFLEPAIGPQSKWLFESTDQHIYPSYFVPDQAQSLLPPQFGTLDCDSISDLLIIALGCFKYIKSATRKTNR